MANKEECLNWWTKLKTGAFLDLVVDGSTGRLIAEGKDCGFAHAAV